MAIVRNFHTVIPKIYKNDNRQKISYDEHQDLSENMTIVSIFIWKNSGSMLQNSSNEF